MRYPEDIKTSSDFIQFDFYEYKSPIVSPGNSGGFTSYQPTAQGTKRSGKTIVMNMPSDVGSSFNGAWGGKETTSLAQAALGQLKGVVGTVTDGNFKNLITQTPLLNNPGASIAQGLKAFGDDGIKALANKFGELPGLGANLQYNDVLQLTSATILNPNTELLYGGFSLRQHGYSFKLIPRSKREAQNVIDIVKTFKVACLPKSKGAIFGTEGNNFLTIPDLVEVSFIRKKSGGGTEVNPHLPKYKLSGIQSVNVSYVTEGGYMSFEDGMPIGIQLTIGLIESKLVFGDEVEGDTYR